VAGWATQRVVAYCLCHPEHHGAVPSTAGSMAQASKACAMLLASTVAPVLSQHAMATYRYAVGSTCVGGALLEEVVGTPAMGEPTTSSSSAPLVARCI